MRLLVLVLITIAGAFDSAAASLIGKQTRMLPAAPPTSMKAIKKIHGFGYPAEAHEVQTEDGYLLTVHRIPHGRKGSCQDENRPIVLLQHGVCACSNIWILREPDKDLAYLLADKGYDVWLANSRGNVHGRRHIYLDPDRDKEFWNFSFHEFGFYDLPATIDYILNKTNQKDLIYIGHSLGTTIFFVMTAARPEYNAKVKLMHGLSPAIYMCRRHTLLQEFFLNTFPYVQRVAESEGIYELFPHKPEASRLMKYLCNVTSPIQPICIATFLGVTGFDYDQLNKTLFGEFFEFYPAGSSLYTFGHIYQVSASGVFALRDFGEKQNLMLYNQTTPPEYPLDKITTPVILYYGDGDNMVTNEDVRATADRLPNLVEVYRVPYIKFNHVDFLNAINASHLVYDHLLERTENFL